MKLNLIKYLYKYSCIRVQVQVAEYIFLYPCTSTSGSVAEIKHLLEIASLSNRGYQSSTDLMSTISLDLRRMKSVSGRILVNMSARLSLEST